jgi:Isochorismatase family
LPTPKKGGIYLERFTGISGFRDHIRPKFTMKHDGFSYRSHSAIALSKNGRGIQYFDRGVDLGDQHLQWPLTPAIQAALPGVESIERRNMNVWEEDAARTAVLTTRRRHLLVCGVLTEACVTLPVLSALVEGSEIFVVADTCGSRL